MDSQDRLAALDRVMDKLDYEDANTVAHAMLGSLSALVDDDQWNDALATASKFVQRDVA